MKAENWADAEFVGFSKKINGGLGPCVIKLGRKFDNYGEYDDIKLNNEVQIWISDGDTDNLGTLIYSGYISSYQPWMDGKEEGVVVNLLGYYTKLAQDIYKNGSNTTIEESSTDIGQMFRNLMDRYRAESFNPKLTYSLDSIKTTGTTGTYTFKMMTYKDAIERIREMAPSGWFWYVNAYNEVKFQSKPTSPTHRFILGRHFKSIKVIKSMEKIKNVVYFYDRISFDQFYEDDASIADYDRRLVKKVTSRVGDSSTAQKIGESFVNEHKDPDVKVIAEIIDNNEDPNLGYDIESIEPGDTCVFEGFDVSLSETFEYNMLITQVDYELDKARIYIEPLKAGIIDRQEELTRELDEVSTDMLVLESRARAYRASSNQSISDSTWTKVQLNAESYDKRGEFDVVNHRFTAKRAGYYLVTAALELSSVGQITKVVIAFYKNGSSVSQVSFGENLGHGGGASHSDIIYLDAGDYLELWVWEDSGYGLNVYYGENVTFMAIHKLSYE
ncbi:MAG: hypothetical protein ACTSR2_01025 [Candidatus Hodarchaeales archaeon]